MFLPLDPEKRKAVTPQNPGVLLLTCGDSRINQELLHQEPGKVFTVRNVGGVAGKNGDASLDAALHFPVKNLEGIKVVVVMGHSDCGAIKGLTAGVLNNNPSEVNPTLNWVTSLGKGKVAAAIHAGHDHGLEPDKISGAMEQIMPVLSARRLMERKIIVDDEEITMGELLKQKNIPVVAALNLLENNDTYLFNIKKGQYILADDRTWENEKNGMPVSLAQPQTHITLDHMHQLNHYIDDMLNAVRNHRKTPG